MNLIFGFYFIIFIVYVFRYSYRKSKNSQSLRFSWYGQLVKVFFVIAGLVVVEFTRNVPNRPAFQSFAVIMYATGLLIEIIFFSISVNLTLRNSFQEKIIALKEIEQLQNLSKMQIAELHEKNEFIKLEEQKRLGRDLHDIVANSLATAKMQVFAVIQDTKDPHLTGQLQSITQQLSEAYNNIRSKSHVWYMGGIEEISQKFIQKFNFLVTTSFPDHVYKKRISLDETTIRKLTSTIQINILLIIQEAITNILKHSNATEISISLYEDNEMVLKIKDNGIGFDDASQSRGVGIKSMSERVDEIDGTLLISSGKEGTEVSVLIPLID